MGDSARSGADNIGGRARTAAGWKFLSTGINAALQMATAIVLARLLMPADFGIVAMAALVTGLANVFRDLGLGQALVQRQEISAEHTRSAFWGTLVMAVLLYAGVYLSAPWVGRYFNEPRMIPVLRVIAISFVLSPLAVVPRSLLQRDLDFKTPLFAGLASSAAYGGTGIVMALLGYGYWALVGAQLAGGVVGPVALCVLTRYVPPVIPNFRGITDLLGFGAGITGVGVFSFLANQADYFVIGRRLDTDALGLYERAFKIMFIPVSLAGILGSVVFPTLSRFQDDPGRARAAFERISTMVTVFAWPVLAMLLVTAHEFVPLVFGEQWVAAVPATQVLMLVGVFRVVTDTARITAKASGTRFVWGDAWRLAVYVLLVGTGAWWASQWGIWGIAWAVFAAAIFLMIFSVHLLHEAIGFGPADWFRATAASFIVAVISGLVALIIRYGLLTLNAHLWVVLIGATCGGAAAGLIYVWVGSPPQLEIARREITDAVSRVTACFGRVEK